MEIKGIKFDTEKVFFTSDTHFHHANILNFCHRPWGDIRVHDSALIQNWNRKVPKDGVVFLLGDFIMTSSIEWTKQLINQLNGTIYLVMGNHDYQNRLSRQVIRDLFENRVYDIIEITFHDYYRFIMCHYPMLYWRRGSYHLHGHVHSGPTSTAKEVVSGHHMRYDVGVDNNNYEPISFEELTEIFLKKKENHINATEVR